MTTYAEFQSFVTDFLWRNGDTDFAAALPKLIKQAEARINRDAKITTLETTAVTVGLTSEIVPWPTDYTALRTLNVVGAAPACYITPAEYRWKQYAAPNRPPFGGYYTTSGKTFLLTGPLPTDPYDVNITYYQKVEPYADEPSAPFYDDYPDFYMAAVLIQCYSWLRDPASAADYETKFVKTLESMMADDNQQKYAGSPLVMRLPGVVR